jgi:hypothetical protein
MQAGAKAGSCLRVSGVPTRALTAQVWVGRAGAATNRPSDATRIR